MAARRILAGVVAIALATAACSETSGPGEAAPPQGSTTVTTTTEARATTTSTTTAPATTTTTTPTVREAILDLGADPADVPASIVALLDATTCAVESVPLGEDVHFERAEVECLHADREASRALVSQHITPEGDPRRWFIWVDGTGRVVVIGDTTEDRYGDHGWVRQDCAGVEADASAVDGLRLALCSETIRIVEADPDGALAGAPGDELIVDTTSLGLDDGTPLVIVELDVDLPTWSFVGRVGDATLRIPATDGALRLDGPEFGEAFPRPVRAGRYEIWSPSGPTGITLEVTGDGEDVGHESERFPTDPELAILREDGLADVDFGTPTDEAIARLIDRFGEPVEDVETIGCTEYRVLRFDDGIHARFDDTFAEYAFYADDIAVDGEIDDDAQPPERPPYTTELAIGLGGDNATGWPLMRYSGEYDGVVFAPIWFSSDRLGGRFADGIGPDHTVISIEAGRDSNPARTVC